jgi:antitoxin component of RelBE/YafQ-DinJ toxin-antitoxin module
MQTRRHFIGFLGLAAFTLPALLGFSHCTSENGALRSLRDVLTKLESAFNLLSTLGLANAIVQAVAKYLESVASFVDQAVAVLEDLGLSTAQRAAKILDLGAQVALPHFEDSRVQAALLTVQAAVSVFLNLFHPPTPAEVPLNQKNKETLSAIETEATNDGKDVEKWAMAHPEAAPQEEKPQHKPEGKH